MGTLVLAGATSGSTTLTPVDAVTTVLTLPSSTATLATLGANTFTGNQSITGTLGVTGAITGTTAALTSTVEAGLTISRSTDATCAIYLNRSGGANSWAMYRYGSSASDKFAIGRPGASEDFIITTAGAVTMPSQPAFLATSAGEANVTGNGTLATLAFTTEVFDQGNNFASSTFTAPVTGKYALFASVTVSSLATNHTEQNFQIVTSNRTYRGEYFTYASSCPFTGFSYKIAVLADMDAGDTAVVKLVVTGGSLVVDVEVGDYSRFSGFLQS